MEGLIASEMATLELEAQVGPTDAASLWYRVSVGLRARAGELSLRDELLCAIASRGSDPQISLDDSGDALSIRSTDGAPPSREPVGGHRTVASNVQFSGPGFGAVEALRRELGAWRAVYLDPRGAMREPQAPREVTAIGDRGQWLVPLLFRLQEADEGSAKFRSIVRAVHAVVPSIQDVRVQLVQSRGELELQVRQNGTWLTARVLSEGTLRVLALCTMAVNPFCGRLLAFEEPENGVHPRRIEDVTKILIAAAREPQQVIVTTHSPLVVGEVVRRVRSGELSGADVTVLASSITPSGTEFRELSLAGALFEDRGMAELLSSADDGARVEAMMLRGGLDS